MKPPQERLQVLAERLALRKSARPVYTGWMQQNLTPEQALALIFEHLASSSSPHSTEAVPLQEALGRVLARDVASPLDLPSFDNSAMDGYALRSVDLSEASAKSPLALTCAQTIAAAPASTQERIPAGQCARIMTGAPLPPGANAVVMREDVDESDAERILFFAGAREGQSIRRRGEDIKRGEVAVAGGTKLRASEIALLAACGMPSVEVSRRPRVAIIVTGDELVQPGQPLQPGQIYNSNAFALSALCQESGAQVVRREQASDDPHQLARLMLLCARECDVLLTSGGVSAGDFDPVRDVLLGAQGLPRIAQPHFWKAAIKPGKPILFASLQNSSAREEEENLISVPIFALPGNPVSVAVCFELFVRPALLWMQGARGGHRRSVVASVDCDGRSPENKTEFVRALVSRIEGSSNEWQAQVSGAQGSGRLTTMTRANALLVIGPDITRYHAGDKFEARLLDG